MSFKSLLVPALSEHTFAGALQAAFQFARTFDGHVVACHVRQPFDVSMQPLPYPLEMSSLGQARILYDEAMDELSESFRGIFEANIKSADFNAVSLDGEDLPEECTATWILRTGDPFDSICRLGRMNDIIIMQHSNEIGRMAEIDLRQRIITEIGKPIFLVPESGLTRFPKTSVIGWNGSLEVTRALTAALPLLQKSERVVLLTIGNLPDTMPTVDDAARYLRFHGVTAEIKQQEQTDDSITDQMRSVAVGMDAEMLVIGGYSHSRMRERIFGGVTHQILRAPEIPVFIVH